MKFRNKLGQLLKNSVQLNSLYNIFYKVTNKRTFFAEQKKRKTLSIFNYQELATPIPYYPLEFVKDSNFYGQNYWVKEFTGLKSINASTEHGLYYGDYIPYSSYCKTIKKIITFSLVRKNVLEKLQKPVVVIGPYIHYVPTLLTTDQISKIRSEYGKILLFFPTHSTREGGRTYSVQAYIKDLKAFAQKKGFYSIFVCMYYYDILHTKLAEYYEEAGFKIVTAGHQLDLNFLPRLKSIISLADYTVSNAVGTHVGYCVYMSKPHWVINPVSNSSEVPQDFREITDVFSIYSDKITNHQYSTVEKYWGLDQVKTPEELHKLLSD